MKQSAKRKKEAILPNYSTQGPDKGAGIAGSPPLGRNDVKQWLGKEGEPDTKLQPEEHFDD